MLGAGEQILQRHQAASLGVVLHGQGVLDVQEQGLQQHAATLIEGRVQQRRNEAVALVVVRLPADRVILISPGNVPHARTGEGHGSEARGLSAQTVLSVIPLQEQRQGQTDFLDDGGRDEAHPPAVVVHVHAAVQPRGVTQIVVAQVVTHSHVFVRLSVEVTPRVNDLTERMQDRAVEHVEHVRTHDGGFLAVVREGHHTQNRLGLNDDIVIEQQHVIGAVVDSLKHAAREATGTTQVALVDNTELTGEGLNNLFEVLVVLHLLGALIHNQELVHSIKNLGALTQSTNVVNAVLHLVHGGNLHSRLTSLHVCAGLNVAQPVRFNQLKVAGASQVEPVPAAVTERCQGQGEGVGLLAGEQLRIHALNHATAVGLVHNDHALAASLNAQHDLLQVSPAAPVRSGERIEVRTERQALARVHGDGAAAVQAVRGITVRASVRHRLTGGVHRLRNRGRSIAVNTGRQLNAGCDTRVHVQGHDVSLNRARENNPLQVLQSLISHGYASTPPDSSFAPLAKCGRILLSNMDSAAPIAMCISRYL